MITQMAAPPSLSRRSQPLPHISQALEQDLVQVFKLLADETRLRVLLYLMQEGEFARFDQNAVARPQFGDGNVFGVIIGFEPMRRRGEKLNQCLQGA